MTSCRRRLVCMEYRVCRGNNSSSGGVIGRVILRGVLKKNTPHAMRREEKRKALEKIQAGRGLTRFPAALDAQFGENALHLRFDRIDRDNQGRPDLLDCSAPGPQAQPPLLRFRT